MLRMARKAYRIACIAFGRKKVGVGILAAIALVALSELPNFYDKGTVAKIQERLNIGGLMKQQAGVFHTSDGSEAEGCETAVILKISDGDTITADVGGKSVKIRMLEVDTPESVHSDASKNNPFGKEASEYTKSKLAIGQTVYLTKDVSDTDRYGRWLRLVWTGKPDNPLDEAEVREKCYNARLLLDGYAQVSIYDDKAYQEMFTRFQEEAMNSRRGLWADDAWWEFQGIQ